MRVCLIQLPETPSADGMTGIYHYARNLGDALPGAGVDLSRVVFRPWAPGGRKVPVASRASLYLRKYAGRLPPADVVHAPHITNLHRRADAFTLHDFIWLDWPQEYPLAHRMFLAFRRRLRRMGVVITPSEAVRRRAIEWLDVPQDQVVAALLAPRHDRFWHEPGLRSPHPSLLYVGELRPRKNVLELLKALDAPGLRDVEFVRCGPPMHGNAYAAECQAFARRAGLRWTDLGYVDSDELRRQYNRAWLFAYPSQGEGFGLPPVEAAACGTPSLVSDLPVFEETLGPHRIVARDWSTEALREALAASLGQAPKPSDLIDWASRLTWQRTAERHVSAYARVLRA